ncbi:P-loop NTPase fold protein [Nocardia sp. NPDC003482]
MFSPLRSDWARDFGFLPDPLTLFGIAMWAVVALIGLLKLADASDRRTIDPDVRLARELLQDLQWETERGTTAKGTVKLRSTLEAGAERTLKLKRRALTRADLVTNLRKLLTLFGDNDRGQRLIVCIDELDKIDSVEHLVEIVNELKDLFHMRRVHFVVAVSTDALASFEKRGLDRRDAFDSALDTIVHTEPLTLPESGAVIASRAPGFAPVIAMFCHAWSGGLARDLLRAARAVVERQRRSSDGPLSLVQFVTELVCSDLDAAIRASMRSLEPGDSQLNSLWLLHECVERERLGGDAARITFDPGGTPTFGTPILQALHAKTLLGLSLLGLARSAQTLPFWDDTSAEIAVLKQRLTDHATAMGAIDAPRPARAAALAAALTDPLPIVVP